MKTMDKFMAILKEGKPVTYDELMARLGIPKANVSAYMFRAKKNHEIEETMDGSRKVFRYLCKTDDKLNLLAQTELRKRAIHLICALKTLSVKDIESTFGIGFCDALTLMGYLVESGIAEVGFDWTITLA